MSETKIRIATRSSKLALWQAHYVSDRLTANGCQVEIIHVSTSGDRDQQGALRSFGGMGVFTREVQRVVLDNDADLAVHSLKDLPGESVEGLCLAAVPERASRYDALVMPASWNAASHTDADDPLSLLPEGAKLGTGSPRRQAQLAAVRPDLQLAEIRGNVGTRLDKLDAGEYEALILAEAGLNRLDHGDRISCRLAPPVMFGAVGQGALGLECRETDDVTRAVLAALIDADTMDCVTAERAMMIELRAGCHAPLGVQSLVQDGQLFLEGVLLNLEGTSRHVIKHSGSRDEATAIGRQVAIDLREQAGDMP